MHNAKEIGLGPISLFHANVFKQSPALNTLIFQSKCHGFPTHCNTGTPKERAAGHGINQQLLWDLMSVDFGTLTWLLVHVFIL